MCKESSESLVSFNCFSIFPKKFHRHHQHHRYKPIILLQYKHLNNIQKFSIPPYSLKKFYSNFYFILLFFLRILCKRSLRKTRLNMQHTGLLLSRSKTLKPINLSGYLKKTIDLIKSESNVVWFCCAIFLRNRHCREATCNLFNHSCKIFQRSFTVLSNNQPLSMAYNYFIILFLLMTEILLKVVRRNWFRANIFLLS